MFVFVAISDEQSMLLTQGIFNHSKSISSDKSSYRSSSSSSSTEQTSNNLDSIFHRASCIDSENDRSVRAISVALTVGESLLGGGLILQDVCDGCS